MISLLLQLKLQLLTVIYLHTLHLSHDHIRSPVRRFHGLIVVPHYLPARLRQIAF